MENMFVALLSSTKDVVEIAYYAILIWKELKNSKSDKHGSNNSRKAA